MLEAVEAVFQIGSKQDVVDAVRNQWLSFRMRTLPKNGRKTTHLEAVNFQITDLYWSCVPVECYLTPVPSSLSHVRRIDPSGQI